MKRWYWVLVVMFCAVRALGDGTCFPEAPRRRAVRAGIEIMKPKGQRHNTIPVPMGGQFSAGATADLPENTVSVLRNYMIRPNRFDGRAPFVWDSLDAVSGFAVWQDLVNELQKTVALCSADNKLYTKNANGVGYTAGVAGLTASTRLTAFTNILGKLWMLFDNGASVPTAAATWDGTTITTTPFISLGYPSTLKGRGIASFIDRLFIADPRVVIAPMTAFEIGLSLSLMYDYSGSTWAKNNVTAKTSTIGANTICILYPTSTTASWVLAARSAGGTTTGWGYLIASSTNGQDRAVFLHQLKNLDPSYDMPITIRALLVTQWQAATAYAVGNVVNGGTSAAGTIQRCTTAGTSGGAAPAWATTVGATTADNTVTWTCEKADNIVAQMESFVPNATTSPNFTSYYLPIKGLPGVENAEIGTQLCFFNTAVPTIKLCPIEVGFQDSYANGDPLKANHGCQWTYGDFYFPFCNVTGSNGTTATVNIDAVIWSEISNPAQILARNTYPLSEIAGLATASTVSNGRLVVFKRSGMWIFKGTADPYEPILPESPALTVGCISPRGLANSRDNVLYWIGENHIYKMNVGSDTFPTSIDSPGMFEEIMARGSNWVESQSVYNLPLLAIDHANNDVWVYTQKGKIYVYSILSGLWSYIDTNPTGTAAEVRAMIFDPTSNRMLVSFGGQAATRFDETSDAGDTIVAGGATTWNIINDIVPKPFELFAARYEASLLEIGLFHNATVNNGSLTLSYSLDRGATYTIPTGYPVTTWLTNPRIRLPLAATGESITIKLSRTGLGGARNFSISKMDALLRVHRGESPRVNAT